MGKPDIWMPLYVADYLADTQHLTTAYHGAYLLMLMASWMRGGRLADDEEQLASICRMDRKAWAKAKPVLAEFFTVQDGFWVQGRLADEYEEAQRISNKNRENGKKGGRPRKPDETQTETQIETQTEPKQVANLKPNETPSPSPTPKKKHSPVPGFEEFYQAYPRKVGRGAAEKTWEKLRPSPELLAEMLSAIRVWDVPTDPQFIPHPSTWLNDKRWLDEPTVVQRRVAI